MKTMIITLALLLSTTAIMAQPSWTLSGAPIGDESTHVYNDINSWTGWGSVSLTLGSPAQDWFEVYNISNSQNPNAVHLYRVDTVPNSDAGIPYCYPSYYYGVFIADTSVLNTTHVYDVKYHYDTCSHYISEGNEPFLELYERNDNAIQNWNNAGANLDTVNDALAIYNEIYRQEYIISSTDLEVEVPDTIKICPFDTQGIKLGCYDSYLWTFLNGDTLSVTDSITVDSSLVDSIAYVHLWLEDACGRWDSDTIVVLLESDPTILTNGPFCLDDPVIKMEAATEGGVWEGTGITDTTEGYFDPMAAGPGIHQIIYSFTEPCEFADTVEIEVVPLPNPTIYAVPELCENEPDINLNAADVGGIWMGHGVTSSSGGSFSPSLAGPGTHTVIYTVGELCEEKDTIEIVVHPAPHPYLGEDIAICHETVQLSTMNEYFAYTWNTDETTPNIDVEDEAVYSVTVTDENGCTGEDDIYVYIECDEGQVWIPNSFSPNGDGLNDWFKTIGFGISEFQMQIFNRWGELIFSGSGLENEWDGTYKGKLVQNGLYVYRATFKTMQVKGNHSSKQYVTGHVTVVY